MSIRCLTQVLEKSVHSGSNLLMLMVLADYSDDDGYSFPAVSSLAHKCRMGVRNANYILKSLQESGELFVSQNKGPKGCNRYRINLEALGSKTMQLIAPLQSTAPIPATHCPLPLQPIADEPSLNHQEPSVEAVVDSLFSLFWKSYPNKVAKPVAIKAFKKAKISSQLLDNILKDIEQRNCSNKWQAENGKYIPNPATYLSQRRWEDETGMPHQSLPALLAGAI